MRLVGPLLAVVTCSAIGCASDVHPADAGRRDVIDAVDAVDVACPPARPIRCNDECVGDTDSNPLHCGATCAACNVPDHGSGVCASGVCGIRCSPGYVAMDGRCVDLPPPHPTRPLTNARVSVAQPTLHWANPPGTHAAHITVCRDRACASLVTEFDADGTRARVPNPLGAGVWFWNLRAIDAGVVSAARSATWSFKTPAVSGPVEWSWAERPDYNGDGIDDLTAVYVDPGLTSYTTEVFLGGPSADRTGIRVGMGRMQPIGDVDGDGFSDFVSFSIDRSTATLFGGAPDLVGLRVIQSIAAPTVTGLDYAGTGACIGDFDGDGFGDTLALGAPTVAYGSAVGWTRFEPLMVRNGLAIAFDMNADGFDDAFSLDRWWPGGAAQLGEPHVLGSFYGEPYLLPIGDLDRDGYLDAVEFGGSGIPVTVLRGTASGPARLVADPVMTTTDRASIYGDAGDLNGDGIADLLVAPRTTTSPVAYAGRPTGYSYTDSFVPSLPCGLDRDFLVRAHRIGDFDASGSDDYVLVCQRSGEVFLHLDADTPAARWLPLRAPHATIIE